MHLLTQKWTVPVLIAATLAVMIAFMVFPQLDLAIAKLYYIDGAFIGDRGGAVHGLRMAFWNLTLVMVIVAVIALSLAYHQDWPQRILPMRSWNVILWSYLLGPGIFVNVLLKGFSQRARPRDILNFGGDSFYAPIGQLSGQCSSDCSFVSGEVSGTVAFCLSCVILISAHQHRISQPARRGLYAALGAMFGYVFLHRVLSGGHFLSDALLAALYTALVMVLVAQHWPKTRDFASKP